MSSESRPICRWAIAVFVMNCPTEVSHQLGVASFKVISQITSLVHRTRTYQTDVQRYALLMGDARYPATIEIRPAVPEDADGIARTFLESAEYHAELDPERYLTPQVETISARYREGRQHPSDAGREVMTLVAELSGEIVGFIDARLEQSPDEMHREMIYCHIAEIAVRCGHRNEGIGGRLLRAAEDWGHRLGAEFASLEYHAANTRAAVFYQERMGYRPASITAIKQL
jgi:ribosomal protein S18 acetylase RimI-like enzyme